MRTGALSCHTANSCGGELRATRQRLGVEVAVEFSKEGAQDERRTNRAGDVLHGALLQVPHPHASRVVLRKPHRPGIAVIARGPGLHRGFDRETQQIGAAKFYTPGFGVGQNIGDERTDLSTIRPSPRCRGCRLWRYDAQGLNDALPRQSCISLYQLE